VFTSPRICGLAIAAAVWEPISRPAHASAKLLAGLPDGKLFPSWKPVTFAASESGCVHAVVGSLSLSKAFEIAV
jgi:hypothetical protein